MRHQAAVCSVSCPVWVVCTVSDSLRLVELNQFEDPGWVRDQTGLLGLTEDGRLQVRIPGFIQNYRGSE